MSHIKLDNSDIIMENNNKKVLKASNLINIMRILKINTKHSIEKIMISRSNDYCIVWMQKTDRNNINE